MGAEPSHRLVPHQRGSPRDAPRAVRGLRSGGWLAGVMPKMTQLLAPNAGYNFGLAGLQVPLVVKGGQVLSLPLLLVSVDRPPGSNVSLAQVLGTLKADLIGDILGSSCVAGDSRSRQRCILDSPASQTTVTFTGVRAPVGQALMFRHDGGA